MQELYYINTGNKYFRTDDIPTNMLIKSIYTANDGSLYFSTSNNKVYFRKSGSTNEYKIMSNFESSNLKEELKIYYEDNQNNLEISNNWFYGDKDTNVF